MKVMWVFLCLASLIFCCCLFGGLFVLVGLFVLLGFFCCFWGGLGGCFVLLFSGGVDGMFEVLHKQKMGAGSLLPFWL